MADDAGKLVFEGLTSERRHLFNIAAILAKGLDSLVLQDAEQPLVIAVNGSTGGGKSIFADAMRRVLLSSASRIAMEGDTDFHERWYARRDGRDIEFGFNNLRSGDFWGGEGDLHDLFSKRRFPGIAVLQNTRQYPQLRPMITIHLERAFEPDEHVQKARDSKLAKELNAAAGKRWNRYVRIEATAPTLVLSETFKRAISRLEAGEHKKRGVYLATAFRGILKERILEFREFTGLNDMRLRKIKNGI